MSCVDVADMENKIGMGREEIVVYSGIRFLIESVSVYWPVCIGRCVCNYSIFLNKTL